VVLYTLLFYYAKVLVMPAFNSNILLNTGLHAVTIMKFCRQVMLHIDINKSNLDLLLTLIFNNWLNRSTECIQQTVHAKYEMNRQI